MVELVDTGSVAPRVASVAQMESAEHRTLAAAPLVDDTSVAVEGVWATLDALARDSSTDVLRHAITAEYMLRVESLMRATPAQHGTLGVGALRHTSVTQNVVSAASVLKANSRMWNIQLGLIRIILD